MRNPRLALLSSMLALLVVLLSGAPFAADAAWTVDTKNRATHDGNPLFLRLAYDSLFDGNGSDPVSHVATRHLENYGFNVYLHYMFGSQENAIRQLPALPLGVFGMATGNANGGATVEQMGTNENGVQTFDLVNNPNNFRGRFNAEPKAGGVYLADEVTVGVMNNVKSWATTYKTSMPNLPRLTVFLPEGPLIPTDGQYGSVGFTESTAGVANVYFWARNGAGGDWLAEDPYTLYKPESDHAPWGYPHFLVADRTAHTVRAAQQNGEVPLTILQLFIFGGGRFITPNEMWSQMVMVVAEGARGIGWWKLGRFGQPDANFQTHDGFADQPDSIRIPADNALKDMTNLLATLEPIILSDPNPALLVGNSTSTGNPQAWRIGVLDAVATAISTYNYGAGGRGSYVAEKNALNAGNTTWSPMLDQSGDVRTRVWEDANGIGYVFAYNYHPNERNAVTLTWHRNLQSVEVLGENRTITPSGASWTDNYGGASSLKMNGKRIGHIYKLTPTGGGAGTPSVSFAAPANNATVSGTITVSLAASGGSGTYTNYTVKLDGTTIYSGQTPSFSWNTTSASPGAHTLTGTVTDSNNATSPAAQINVTVSQGGTPLTVDITQPTNGSTVSGTNWVIVWPHNAQGTPTCTVKVDGVQVAQQTCPDSPTSIPWNTTAVGNGAHTLTVTITDSTPRTGSTSVNITVSNGPPLTVDITQPTNGSTVSGTNWVIVWPHNAQGTPTCTIKVGTTQVAQQACGASPTSIPWNTTAFTNGPYTLTVTITDSTPRSGSSSVHINVSN